LHYTFDNVGNILSVQDNARGETTNYAYDDLNRLLTASVANGGSQYSRSRYYDATLGRFISADTIVPSAGNPQNLNHNA